MSLVFVCLCCEQQKVRKIIFRGVFLYTACLFLKGLNYWKIFDKLLKEMFNIVLLPLTLQDKSKLLTRGANWRRTGANPSWLARWAPVTGSGNQMRACNRRWVNPTAAQKTQRRRGKFKGLQTFLFQPPYLVTLSFWFLKYLSTSSGEQSSSEPPPRVQDSRSSVLYFHSFSVARPSKEVACIDLWACCHRFHPVDLVESAFPLHNYHPCNRQEYP